MPTINPDQHDLVFRVIVMGGASEAFVQGVPLENGELHAGEVQGWRPRFSFEAFPLNPWSGDAQAAAALEKSIAYADALVLTDALAEGTHYSSSAVERLGRLLAPTRLRIPAVIFGGPALALEWESLSGVKPVAVVDPNPDHAMAAVKALAKVLLRSRMKSTPPPPTSS
jgi:hypothetical protein